MRVFQSQQVIDLRIRTEHYEIAGYTAAIAMADTLGLKDVSVLLATSLNKERQAAEKILAAARPILQESANRPEDENRKPKTEKEKYSAQKSREDEKKAAPSLV